MIYRLPKFEYIAPKTVEEVLSLLSQHKGQAKVMAGGTDLLVNMKQRTISPAQLISLVNLTEELGYIRQDDEGGGIIRRAQEDGGERAGHRVADGQPE